MARLQRAGPRRSLTCPFRSLCKPHVRSMPPAIHNRGVTNSASPANTAAAPRAVIFDFGRVLSMPPDADAHTALVAAAGVPDEIFEEHYWAHRHAYDAGALNGQTYWQMVSEGAGFPLTPERLPPPPPPQPPRRTLPAAAQAP